MTAAGPRPEGSERVRIRFEGDCTVARAEELRDGLLAAIREGGPVELDFSSVTRIDMSFCQLILALRKSPACQAAGLSLVPNLPPGLAEAACRCGLPGLASPEGASS